MQWRECYTCMNGGNPMDTRQSSGISETWKQVTLELAEIIMQILSLLEQEPTSKNITAWIKKITFVQDETTQQKLLACNLQDQVQLCQDVLEQVLKDQPDYKSKKSAAHELADTLIKLTNLRQEELDFVKTAIWLEKIIAKKRLNPFGKKTTTKKFRNKLRTSDMNLAVKLVQKAAKEQLKRKKASD